MKDHTPLGRFPPPRDGHAGRAPAPRCPRPEL